MAYREKLRSARMGTGMEVSSSSTPSLFFSTYFSNAPILRTYMYHKYVITSYVLRHNHVLRHIRPAILPCSGSPWEEDWTRGCGVALLWRWLARRVSWWQTDDVCTSLTLRAEENGVGRNIRKVLSNPSTY